MATITHKHGIHEKYLLMRHIKLEGVEPAGTQSIIDQLSELREIDNASFAFTGKNYVLSVSYDASIKPQPLEDARQILDRHGITIARDWWTRNKVGYYEFVDQNVFDNARHEPWCCHKVPPGK